MDCKYFGGTDSEEFVIFTQDDLHAERFPLMMEIRRQGKLCDVILKVEDHSFSAHRIVLASTIPFFYAMFTNDMVESRMKEITMKEIDPMALELLINFAYSGSVKIDNENVRTLIVGAAVLQMNRVRDACAEFLFSRVDAHDVLVIRRIADCLGRIQLVSEAEKYIQGNFSNIAESDKFLNLTDRVATEDSIRTSLQCRDLLDEARDFHLIPERRGLIHSFRTRPRCYDYVFGQIFAVGGIEKDCARSSKVEIYDPLTKEWKMGQAMSMRRGFVGVPVTDGKLFAFGGENGFEALRTVVVYDPKTKVWFQRKPMQFERFGSGVAVLDDRVYICGGFNGWTRLRTVECYLPKTDSWTTVAPMMEKRWTFGAAALNGYVYALGGFDGTSILDSVERYDPKENSWTKITPMMKRRTGLGVTTLNGKLYACGGYDGYSYSSLNSVEEYDPTKHEWRLIAPMNVKRYGVALCANMGKLWAIGGYDGESYSSTVEVWDPNEDTWSFAASMGGTRIFFEGWRYSNFIITENLVIENTLFWLF